MSAAAILDFWNREISLSNGVQRVEAHQRAKYRQNLSIGCEDIKIFRIFKMAAVTILLDFQICEISLADSVWRAKTHHHAKCCQNRSFCCGDIAVFRISKMAAAVILDFWNREILSANMPNFLETGPSIAEILHFFEVSRWPSPPSLIFKITNFLG